MPNVFNRLIKCSKVPSILKLADIITSHKKGKKDMKKNYKPISISPNLSKIFEKCIFSQISSFFESNFAKYQCVFRKGFSTQQCLIGILEKWKHTVDKGKIFGALLTDLPKAFDCFDYEILTSKLNGYGFSLAALKLIRNYLLHRKQRKKISSSSEWALGYQPLPQKHHPLFLAKPPPPP